MDGDIIIQNDVKKAGWKRPVLVVSIIIIALLVVAGVIALIIGINSGRRDVVRISNYDELPYVIPDSAQEEFGGYLYHLLRQHFEVPEDGSKITANIRIDTYEPVQTGQVETVKFVIDVEDYKQSYNAKLSWSSSLTLPESASIECTKKKDSKYQDTPCYGMSTTSDSIKIYLPDQFELTSGETVKLEYGYTTSDGKDIVKVIVGSCGNKTVEDSALARAKHWVKLQGLKEDTFEYKVVPEYENCIIRGDG